MRAIRQLYQVEHQAHSVAFFAMSCNFVRIHKTLRTTPAMAAERLWDIGAVVDALEACENRRARAEIKPTIRKMKKPSGIYAGRRSRLSAGL